MTWIKDETNRIHQQIEQYQRKNYSVFYSTSLQSHSLPLLHLISTIKPRISIAFIQTGFHFPETLHFAKEIEHLFKIEFIFIEPSIPKSLQKDAHGHFLFSSDPDYCCHINKVNPMENFKNTHDVWISGIRADQNANRKSMSTQMDSGNGKLRYHPILHWTPKMIFEYQKAYNLPKHPLEEKGYLSIGCQPCTRKYLNDGERNSRWFGLNKQECGLHTELVNKSL